MHRTPLADVNGRILHGLSDRPAPRTIPNTNATSNENTSLRGSLSLDPLLALSANHRLRIEVDDWLRGLSITERAGPNAEPFTRNLEQKTFHVEEIERPSSSLSNSTESSFITVISAPLVPPRDQENSPPPPVVPVATQSTQPENTSDNRSASQREDQQSR